jgi:beta-aspartyl-peptidase (threonine type)
MKFLLISAAATLVLLTLQSSSILAQEKPSAQATQVKYALVIHGGAGTILKKNMTPEKEAAYKAALELALKKGHEVLKNGGTSMDAVCAAVNVLEDSPLFNAGKGAVFTAEGKNEMDAAIMNGKTLEAGAVAGIRHIKNPILLARAVMEKSSHLMLTGEGAEQFARTQGFRMMPEKYFYTPERWQSLQKAKDLEKHGTKPEAMPADKKHGTVGAVAVDKEGNLAAATSTGGMTNKKWGRVGDAPILGAGTYADNATCAVSCTGHGEYFIRAVVAHDVAARMAYKGIPLEQAADEVVMKRLVEMHGEGGLIAIDRNGNIAMPFNSAGMYRGAITWDGVITTAIYKNE